MDESHKKLMSALGYDHLTTKENTANSIACRQLEKETGNNQRMKNTEESGAPKSKTHPPSGASYASLRGSHTHAQTTNAPAPQPTGASHAPLRATRRAGHGPAGPPTGASHAPTRVTYMPTRASGAKASAARQAAMRDQLVGGSPPDAMAE